jgi:23S rRNA (adenine2030-N6)-methyltransferase
VKYRHAFHAGNFADVHKHVTLLALLRGLARKDTGFLLLDTHAGRGLYDLGDADARKGNEAATGITRLEAFLNDADRPEATELADYLGIVQHIRSERRDRRCYPGSPLLGLHALRPQDRAVFIETQPSEHAALRAAVGKHATVECADGFLRLANWLPPRERRALVLIDPPYEETAADFRTAQRALNETLRRLANAVVMIWYPIKHGRDTDQWLERLALQWPTAAGGAAIPCLVTELWVHPRDNRAGLNGSGLLIANPPYLIAEQMRIWLPELHRALDPARAGGWLVRESLAVTSTP